MCCWLEGAELSWPRAWRRSNSAAKGRIQTLDCLCGNAHGDLVRLLGS